MTYIDRNKFTTELGRKLYDILKPISPNEDWLYFVLMLTKGDDKKKILMDFLNNNDKEWNEIGEFVRKNWGNEYMTGVYHV